MGDQQDTGTVLLLELFHQVQDLGLDGHVQGGGGLVGDQELRVVAESHGDHDTLAHTAGQLVRVVL